MLHKPLQDIYCFLVASIASARASGTGCWRPATVCRGAEAALESFSYGLNNRDLDALRADWTDSLLAASDHPRSERPHRRVAGATVRLE